MNNKDAEDAIAQLQALINEKKKEEKNLHPAFPQSQPPIKNFPTPHTQGSGILKYIYIGSFALVVVLLLAIYLKPTATPNQLALYNQNATSAIEKSGQAVANTVNHSLNSLNASVEMAVGHLNDSANAIITITNKTAKNLSTQLSNINSSLTHISKNASDSLEAIHYLNSSIPTLLNQSVNRSVKELSNTIRSNSIGVNTIKIWTIPQAVAANDFIENQMLDTFDMHIDMNASTPVKLYVMTMAQYANFSTANATEAVQSYSSTGPYNSIKFDFLTSTGCGAYVYVIEGVHLENFTIYPNVSATYMPSATLQGICT